MISNGIYLLSTPNQIFSYHTGMLQWNVITKIRNVWLTILGNFWSESQTTERNIRVPIDMQRKNLRSVNIALRIFPGHGGIKEEKSGGHVCFPRHTLRHKKGDMWDIDRFSLRSSGIRKRGVGFSSPGNFFLTRDRMIMQNRGRLMCCEGNWKYDRYDRLKHDRAPLSLSFFCQTKNPPASNLREVENWAGSVSNMKYDCSAFLCRRFIRGGSKDREW